MRCPNCGFEIEEKSKSHIGLLEDYYWDKFNLAPGTGVSCDNCGKLTQAGFCHSEQLLEVISKRRVISPSYSIKKTYVCPECAVKLGIDAQYLFERSTGVKCK